MLKYRPTALYNINNSIILSFLIYYLGLIGDNSSKVLLLLIIDYK